MVQMGQMGIIKQPVVLSKIEPVFHGFKEWNQGKRYVTLVEVGEV